MAMAAKAEAAARAATAVRKESMVVLGVEGELVGFWKEFLTVHIFA